MNRVIIKLEALHNNLQVIDGWIREHGATWTVVTKVLCGHSDTLRALWAMGVRSMGDSRLNNVRSIQEIIPEPGLDTWYLRVPHLASVGDVASLAGISLNSETTTIEALNQEAGRLGRTHRIIIMIELGDLREGILPGSLVRFYEQVFDLPHIEVLGIGSNLGCISGQIPTIDQFIQGVDDFLVAGRNVGWFFLFCTMGATVIGGGASVGAIGKTYEWGVLMLLVSSGWYLHFVFSGLVVAPVFREAKLYTVAGYFGLRFGEGPRFVVMVLSIFFSLFIIAAQMAAFGSVLSAIVPEFADSKSILVGCIVVGGLMVVVYSTAGGLMAVIQTDVYQFVILLVGLVVTLLFCVPDLLASWGQVRAQLPASFFALDGGKGCGFALTTFLAFLLGETFAPGYATRYCVGKNIRETRLGIAGVGVFLALVFPAILFFIALYARLHFPDIDPQHALPMVVGQVNSPIVAGMMVGALLMAVMSSADSALNSATAIFVKDLFEHQLGRKSEDRKMLRLTRTCSAVLGGAAIVVAAAWRDVIDLASAS